MRNALQHNLANIPLPPHCQQPADSDKDKESKDKDKDKEHETRFEASVLARHHKGGAGGVGGGSAEVCRAQYVAMLVYKSMVIVRKLLPFVRDGNYGHQRYVDCCIFS